MSLKLSLVGEAKHLVVDTGWIADAQDVDATVDEFFGYPVDGHIALSADKHLTLAHKGFVDGLNESGGLSGAGRTVDDGHILGPQHLIDGAFLGGVEPGEAHRGKGKLPGFLV